MISVLTLTALILYLLNYAIGWLLHFKRISISKRTHQLLFALIIINLSALILYRLGPVPEMLFLLISLVAMLILPFGSKGGYYHRIVSSIGLISYVTHICLY